MNNNIKDKHRYRSVSRERSQLPYSNRSPSPYRNRSPSPYRNRSPSPYSNRSPSPYRNRSPSQGRSMNLKNKFGLYKHQKEYVFPIGIHEDIDQSIIEKMDFTAIINLLKINKSPKLRMLISKNIGNIIENSKDYSNYDLSDILYELLELKELYILRSIDISSIPDDIMNDFYRNIDINIEDNRNQIVDCLSILSENQTKNFTKMMLQIFNDSDDYGIMGLHYRIGYNNKLLDLALELENVVMIDTIKDWFIRNDLILLTNELKRLRKNLGL